MFLTLCFYEFPAAKAHIDFWEKSMGDRIIEKQEFDSMCKAFYIKKGNQLELVYCVPLHRLIIKDFEKDLEEIPISTIFLKTLVFGKINKTDLLLIDRYTNDVSNVFAQKEI
ncbi:MAG: hypothetical protein PHF86_03065 [Candidatus Nanoarchaeia archaeon]|jgi:hypothetical protein|nr:hypothetical protein [Candidatus Nanoarchaeia archaeon]